MTMNVEGEVELVCVCLSVLLACAGKEERSGQGGGKEEEEGDDGANWIRMKECNRVEPVVAGPPSRSSAHHHTILKGSATRSKGHRQRQGPGRRWRCE